MSHVIVNGRVVIPEVTFEQRMHQAYLADQRNPRRCRVCGCTDLDCSGCYERTGEPCSWIEPDLCGACEPGVGP